MAKVMRVVTEEEYARLGLPVDGSNRDKVLGVINATGITDDDTKRQIWYILTELLESGTFSWNRDGNFTYNQVESKSSNIVTLVKYAMEMNPKLFQEAGKDDFRRALLSTDHHVKAKLKTFLLSKPFLVKIKTMKSY